MKRLLLLVAIAVPACDDPIPGLCKTDRDCPAVGYCYQGVCLRREEPGQDAGQTRCSEPSSRCAGSTPEVCVDGGWVSQAACTGAKPVCSNGLCGAYRVTGGLRAVAAADGGMIRLVTGSLELGTRSCSTDHLCVVGGIAP